MAHRVASLVLLWHLVRGFDLQRAQDAAEWSAAAYCDHLEGWACGVQCRGRTVLERVSVIRDNSTQGQAFVGYHHNSSTIVIAFRGTVLENFQNWWDDLSSVDLVPYHSCPAHGCLVGSGFLLAYEALREGVFERLNVLRAAFPDARLIITGHSLGASIAHLCVLECHQRRIPVHEEITFGSPRTGNKPFAQYLSDLKGHHWRVTHDQDPIPHLPMWDTPFDFWHVSTEVFFPSQIGLDHRLCLEGEGEDRNCSMRVVPYPSPRDHVHYLDLKVGSQFCLP